jgi:predicted kinase
MESSNSTNEESSLGPFSSLSDGSKHWQTIYASAVAITQLMQRNGIDPYEANNLRADEIHMIFISAKIYTFEEQLIFDVAIQLLAERHKWSYGN